MNDDFQKCLCKVKLTLVNSILNFDFIVICTVNSEQILLSIEKQTSLNSFHYGSANTAHTGSKMSRDKLQHKMNQRANIASA